MDLEPIDFDDHAYPISFPDPQVDIVSDAITINQDVDTTIKKEERDLERPSLPDSKNTQTEEPSLMDCNPDLSHETVLWNRIMEEKRIRKQDFHIIKRERQMLEGERRQIMQLKMNMEQQQQTRQHTQG